jgi:hypothetical protein
MPPGPALLGADLRALDDRLPAQRFRRDQGGRPGDLS